VDLRVLGSSATYPTPHNPCSGFLVTGEESRVWMDAGTGTFAALQSVVDFLAIDAVVISHFHADHCLDLFPFYYALRFHPDSPRGVPVYAPKGTRNHLAQLIAGDSVATFSEVLDFREVEPGDKIEIGDIALGFALTEHPIPTHAISITAGGHHLVYSADTGPGGDICTFASGADSFICEATYQDDYAREPLHLTASEAGEIAARADVGALFLTHLWPTLDANRSCDEARRTWGRSPVVLQPGMVLSSFGRRMRMV
jgi:ribonuclease BN (tRNA processing enzyme)